MGYHSLLQGILPTQGADPGFLHCRQIIYHLSRNLETPFWEINWRKSSNATQTSGGAPASVVNWRDERRTSKCLCLVVSDCLWPFGPQASRLLCPWDFAGKNVRVVFISFSRGSSLPRDQTCVSYVSCIASEFFTCWTNREALKMCWWSRQTFETIHFCGLYLEFVTILFPMSLSFKSEPQKRKNSVGLFLAINSNSCIIWLIPHRLKQETKTKNPFSVL